MLQIYGPKMVFGWPQFQCTLIDTKTDTRVIIFYTKGADVSASKSTELLMYRKPVPSIHC